MIIPCNKNGIDAAVDTIKTGGVVVFPTDTVYGIGCNPYDKTAVERIYRIKGREKEKQLPVLAYSYEELQRIVSFDDISKKLAEKFWPGALTLILPLKDKDIGQALGIVDRLAVRVPNHSCLLSLLKECKILVGTSANYSGSASFADPSEIAKNFSGFDLLLDGGKIENSVESTIVEVVNNKLKVIREGKVNSKLLI